MPKFDQISRNNQKTHYAVGGDTIHSALPEPKGGSRFRWRLSICLILTALSFSSLWGQTPSADKIRRAQELYAYRHFQEAQAILAGDRQLSRFDKEGRFLLALCYYQLNQLDRSALLLNELIEKEKTPYPECWLFMGKIFHDRHQFEKAADYYKLYLKLLGNDPQKRRLIWDDLERCAFGLSIQYKEQRAFAENLGSAVNTEGDEFGPVASPTRSDRLYFSSARDGSTGGLRNAAGQSDETYGFYRADMYVAGLNRGVWGAVEPMSYLHNSPQQEILLDVKADGSVLYYFYGNVQDGAVRVDTFQQLSEKRLTSDPFPGPIDPNQGDQFPHFVNDTLVFFASTRPGGYGGTDLYKITYRHGRWSSPQNLGPDINTPYQETTPFLARNMQTLFYSTDHPAHSIGGLDVVKAVYVPDLDRWAPPQNLGLPINSSADDVNFRLTKDGFSGFLSSSRKDGLGQRDIYAIYFQDFLEEMEPPVLASQVSVQPPAVVYSPPPPVTPVLPDAQPVIATTLPAANMEVAENPTLPPPAIEQPELELPAIRPVLVENGSSLDEKTRSVLNLIAEKWRNQGAFLLVVTSYSHQQLNPMQQLTEGMNLSEEIAGYLYQQGLPSSALFLRSALADLSKAPNYSRLVAFNFIDPAFPLDETPKGSDYTLENPWLDLSQEKTQQELHYKVQVAASQKNNVRVTILEEYADPMLEKLPDFAYYRYTIGAFNTYQSANKFRRDLQQYGQKSAYVIPYLQGYRLEKEIVPKYAARYPDLNFYLGKNN